MRSFVTTEPFWIQLIEEGKITPAAMGSNFYAGNDYPVQRDFVPVYSGDILTVEILGVRWSEKSIDDVMDEELK